MNPYNRTVDLNPFVGITVVRNTATGRGRYNTYINCTSFDDCYYNSEGVLKLTEGGRMVQRRFPGFAAIMERLRPYESPFVFDAHGVLTKGEEIVSGYKLVCASDFKARAATYYRNRASATDFALLIKYFTSQLLRNYVELFTLSSAGRDGLSLDPGGNQEGTDVNKFFTRIIEICSIWREKLTKSVDGAFVQLYTGARTPDALAAIGDTVPHNFARGDGWIWAVNKLDEFINFLQEVPPTLFKVAHPWGIYIRYTIPPVEVLYGWYGNTPASELAHFTNLCIDRTLRDYQWCCTNLVHYIQVAQRVTNIVAGFEKFCTYVEADTSAAPSKALPNDGRVHEPDRALWAEQRKGNTWFPQRTGLDRYDPAIDFYGPRTLKTPRQFNPTSKGYMAAPEHYGSIWLAECHPILFNVAPMTGSARAYVDESHPVFPPPAPATPPQKAMIWDNTIHPLTPKEEQEERASLLEQIEENERKVCNALLDVAIQTAQWTGKFPTGPAGAALNVLMHEALTLGINRINPYDDPYEHTEDALTAALPEPWAGIVTQILDDMTGAR